MTHAAMADPVAVLDVASLRSEFPILARLSRGRPLVYLDNAATSQKPQRVIDAVRDFYQHDNANIHRGVYQLSEQATVAWDGARATVARFIGASSPDGIVFVRGTTEAINLVAQSFVRPRVVPGGVVLVSEMEHHANIVPWQLAGATTVPIPLMAGGELDLAAAETFLARKPVLLAITHVSNALGTINPVAELVGMARSHGVPTLVDGAQAVPHVPVDVSSIGCDFYCFSAHKMFGPMGIGVLWARPGLLGAMPPYQGGGDMIDTVGFDRTTYAAAPGRFEAGTPDVAGAIGLVAAIDWLGAHDRSALSLHEDGLRDEAIALLGEIPAVQLVQAPTTRAPVVAFTVAGAHPHDVASILDGDGICVRAGHHCTQPLHRRLGLAATVRASFAPYNTREEVAALARSVRKVTELFR